MELITANQAREMAIPPSYIEDTVQKINKEIKSAATAFKHSTTVDVSKAYYFEIRDFLYTKGYKIENLKEDVLYIKLEISW